MKPARQPLSLIIGLIAAALLLVACASEPAPAATAAPQGSPTAADTPIPATKLPDPTEPAGQPAPTEALASDDACLACHTDKDQLIDTADPEQEVISESKGEG